MPIFRHLGFKFLKTNVRFEISTFETVHMRNFIKIGRLILFGIKCQNLGIWAQNFRKPMLDLKSAHSKQGTSQILLRLESKFETVRMQNFIKIGKLILFGPKCPNLGIWARNFQKPMTDLKLAPSK